VLIPFSLSPSSRRPPVDGKTQEPGKEKKTTLTEATAVPGKHTVMIRCQSDVEGDGDVANVKKKVLVLRGRTSEKMVTVHSKRCFEHSPSPPVQSVTLKTDLGDIKIEVFCEAVPRTAENFLALCASGYYNNCLFVRYATTRGSLFAPDNTATTGISRGSWCRRATPPTRAKAARACTAKNLQTSSAQH